MSRAINVEADEADVTKLCAKHGATVTSIETLRSGGTRVVLANGDSAATIRRAFGAKVIDGNVLRQPSRVAYSSHAEPVTAPAPNASFPWKPTRDR